MDERTRRKEFAPFKVRDALQAIGTPIQVSAQVYGELSGRNVHVNPETAPQTYNISSRPLGGGYYQEAGFLLCENELAVVLTFVIYSAARLADLAPEKSMQMLIAGRDLISSTGSIGIGNISTMWDDIKKGRSRP